MVNFKEFAAKNASVDISGQRALISGGTQGIGAGIALRFALAGASVWLIGRNEAKAQELLSQLENASAEAQRKSQQNKTSSVETVAKHEFFKADLSLVTEVERVANEISQRAGKHGIDYLIETQGGPPNGKITATSEGIDSLFAVQVLSRFGLANLLASKDTIRRGIVMVAAPGKGGNKPVDLDDIDFLKAHAKGSWWGGPFGILQKGARGSSLLDSVCQTLAENHPSLTVSHLFPGFVATDALANQNHSGPLVWAGKLFAPLFASSAGPGGYAELPLYLLAHPEGQRILETKNANYLSPDLSRVSPSPYSTDPQQRQQAWQKLTSYFQQS